MGSAAFVVADHLEAELSFAVAVGLEGSGILAAADVVPVAGLLAPAAGGSRLTSFLAAAGLGGCAAVVLPVEGAVVTLEAAVLAAAGAEGLVAAVVGLDVEDAGRDVEGPIAVLVVFEMAPPSAFAVVEVLGFGAADVASLLVVARLLGLVALTVSAAVLLLGAPFTAVLVPFVAVAAATDVVLVGPTGFLSGTLVWFLAAVETAATRAGFFGTAPAADADAAFAVVVVVVVVFLAELVFAELLLEDWTLFVVRCDAAPGRELDPVAPAVLSVACIFDATPCGLTLGSAASGLPLVFGAAPGAASFAACSGCDGACSVMLSCDTEGSASAAASVGSVVSMVTPSGFIPSKGVEAGVAVVANYIQRFTLLNWTVPLTLLSPFNRRRCS